MKSGTGTSGIFEGAEWIWPEEGRNAQNCHAYLRKSFLLGQNAESAVCRVTSNTSYRLFANGCFTGRGPVRSSSKFLYFDEYDLADYLHKGLNIIAAHAYSHGKDDTGALNAFSGPPGFLANLTIEFPGGEKIIMVTDGSWKAIRAPQYAADTGFITWHRQDYKEQYDAGREPAGWQESGFCDRAWPAAAVVEAWKSVRVESFIPNPLPPMSSERVYPENAFSHHSGCAYGFTDYDVEDVEAVMEDNDEAAAIMPLSPGFEVQVLLDFGRPVAGYFHLDFSDAGKGDVFISYGDSLNLTRIDRLVMKDGGQHYSPYDRRFGRYVMLTFRGIEKPVLLRRAWFELSAYPAIQDGAFFCSDPLLNRIYRVGLWTLRMNMHDQFEDCPFREQTLYAGDLRVSALPAYYAFGAFDLARESILKLARLQKEDGVIPNSASYPSKGSKTIPEYPALWLVALRDYCLHSGDYNLAAELWPRARRLMEWYASWEDEAGLMRQLPGDKRSDFVDNLAGIPMDGRVLAVECFYYLALEAARELANALGDKSSEAGYLERKKNLARAVNGHFWDDRLKGYLSCLGGSCDVKTRLTPDLEPDESMPLSRISNGMALYAGIAPPGRREGALAAALGHKPATPARSGYMNYYIADALFQNSRGSEALNLIRRYWGEMIRRGAESFWEVFDESSPAGRQPDRKWSLCHEFCAGPAYMLPARVLGIVPAEAGFSRITVRPQFGDLSWASGSVATPLGPVESGWKFVDGRGALLLDITRPPGMEMDLETGTGGPRFDYLEIDGEDMSGLVEGGSARAFFSGSASRVKNSIVLRHKTR